MPESQIETAKGNSTIALTRHIMEKYNLTQEKAFAKLSATEFYGLLNDTGTNLFLETNDYLCKACDFELDGNVDEMYSFIIITIIIILIVGVLFFYILYFLNIK